jgi:hypothetical protein
MSTANENERQEAPLGILILLCIGALLLMVGLMYYSIIYPYPSGKSPDISSFVAFWFKEILILGLVVAGLCVGLVAWLFKLIRSVSARGKNAL